ncbi:MAG TPA: serine hydrolase [Phenylobacterium sp.]|nr:serine hydrolase [Phenylobacterium sp.]
MRFLRAVFAGLLLAALGVGDLAAQAPPSKPIPYEVYNRRYQPARPRPKAAPRPAATPDAALRPAQSPGLAPVTPAPPQPPGARLPPGAPIPPVELEAFVDGVVREAMARDHIAGVTVSVVQGGQVVLKKGYGFADMKTGRRVDPDRTLFRIASISKTFTWIALMKEVEAGRIRLDRPINLYLPERVQVRDQGYDRPVLVRHLMDHSAGFEDRALGQLFEQDFDRVRPLELYLRQERPDRVRPPGVLSSYSNYGVGLAGEAVAYVSGQPYETYVARSILQPLALTSTTFLEPHPAKAGLPPPMPPALAARLATPYRWTPAGFQARRFEHVMHAAPAGGASTTAGDMARYMQLLLNGGTIDGVAIYGPRTAAAFNTPIDPMPTGVNGWAHGMIETTLPGGFRGFGHDGATISFMSKMVVSPQLGLGVFVSTNTESGGRLAHLLPFRIVERFYAAPRPPAAGSPALKAAAEAFEGTYLTTRRAYSGLEGFVMRIAGQEQVSVTRDGVLLTQGFDGSSERFVLDGPVEGGLFRSAETGEAMTFAMRNGRAREFRPAQNAAVFQRVGPLDQTRTLALLGLVALVAAAATLVGAALRIFRETRQGLAQRRASLLQTIQAALWIIAGVSLAVYVAGAADRAKAIYDWPSSWLIIASACALVASILNILTLVLTPLIWQGGRRVESWSGLRKFAYTFTVLIYGALGLLLLRWGALFPWSA